MTRCAICDRPFVYDPPETMADPYSPGEVPFHPVCADALLKRGESDPLIALLARLSGDGCADDFMGQDDYAELFGRMILVTDSRGFRKVREYASDAAAERDWSSWYDDGMGAQEDDAFISSVRGGYEVTFSGRHLGTFERESRARAAISLEMRRTGLYPNVWMVSDHGNLTLGEVW